MYFNFYFLQYIQLVGKGKDRQKGTEDNIFRMNHASEIDLNILKTSGDSFLDTTLYRLYYQLVEVKKNH